MKSTLLIDAERELICRTNIAEEDPSWLDRCPLADNFSSGWWTTLGQYLGGFANTLTGEPVVGGTTNDFGAASLGQLKFKALPLYERLVGIGYLAEIPGYPIPEPNQQNYAAANIGQARYLLSLIP